MARARVIVLVGAVLTILAGIARWWRAEPRTQAAPPADGGTFREDPEGGAGTGLGVGDPPDDAAVPRKITMLHGDSRRTHRASGVAPRSTPEIAWARDVGGPIEAQVTASPDERTLYVASLAGTLTALGKDDGDVHWTLRLGDRAYATPCVGDDGTIYQGSDAKKMVAVSPEGKVIWSLDTAGDADTGPALADDGTVVFAAGRMVYGVGRHGQVVWRFATKRKVFAAPALDASGRVFVASQDHHVYALGPEHRAIWSVDLDADVDGAPAIGDDQGVFVGTDGDEVVRLNADDGHVVWRTKVWGYVRGALSIARNGDVLAGVYGPSPRQVRLRAADGAWVGSYAVQGTGAREFGVHGGALEDARGTVIFGTQADDVIAVDSGGKLLWRVVTGGDVDAPVTLLSDGTLVIASDDGLVRVYRPAP
ncbi:MAG: PQQ-binding-like beta-propeller repeat protein [Polyangiaceae bacterium]|nr:PQQ-binding-like beta-propeller repeat protein [Polyangiaceae bacterium]